MGAPLSPGVLVCQQNYNSTTDDTEDWLTEETMVEETKTE
jgi:hypothetical protein